MNTYTFYQDQKVTSWERTHFEIKAESYQEAVAIIQSWQGKEVGSMEDDKQVFITEFEPLLDTSEYLSPSENNGQATIEVFDHTGAEICDNSEVDTQL